MSSANTSSGSRWPHLHLQGPRLGRPDVCADQPCRAADDSGWVTSGATGIRVRDRVGRSGTVPRELAAAEIDEYSSRFVAAAVRAKRAACDGVKVHACHGYLLSSLSVPGAQPARRLVWGVACESRPPRSGSAATPPSRCDSTSAGGMQQLGQVPARSTRLLDDVIHRLTFTLTGVKLQCFWHTLDSCRDREQLCITRFNIRMNWAPAWNRDRSLSRILREREEPAEPRHVQRRESAERAVRR